MELFTLFGKIAIDNANANKSIDDTNNKAKSLGGTLGSALGKAASKVGSFVADAGKMVAAGVAVGAAGVATLTNVAVKGYAEYEQLVGGVETLFKDSAGTVQQYAANAYKTSGLSANQYMETVTSFSASLLQSLKGDTAAAADYAEMAVTDMSDNANKMGSDMTSIQNAYQGFAKQNYTMLDNLKLGYGGTKEEMNRLINDAAKLDKSVKKNDMSFGNIVKAIHAMQVEMGIAGTTAVEADKTISGSVASVKAAWSNLMVGMADENANMDQLINNVVETASTAGKNILPVVQKAISGAGTLVSTLVPQVFAALPEFVSNTLPGLVESGMTVVESIATAIPGVIDNVGLMLLQQSDSLLESAGSIVSALVNALVSGIPTVILVGKTLLSKLISAITENAPQIVETAVGIVSMLVSGLASAAPQLITGAAAMIAVLITELGANAGQLVTVASDLITSLVNGLVGAAPGLILAATSLIVQFALALTEPGMLKQILAAGLDLILALVDGIFAALPQIAAAIPDIIMNIVNFLIEGIPMLYEAGKELLKSMLDGFGSNWEAAKAMWADLMPRLIEGAKAYFEMWKNIGKDIVDNILEGLKSAWASVTSWFSEAWGGMFGGDGTGATIALNGGASAVDGSHASGLDYVPYNGYIAELHKGEMVVPAAEAAALRSGAGNGEVLSVLNQILAVLSNQDTRFGASMREAMEGVSLSMNNREFGRLVNAAVKG